jgi:hypothetical protein
MFLRVLLVLVVLGWPAQAGANGCADLYNAIKKAAMYCGFFCDQDRIGPLQLAYETRCIVRVIPSSPFNDDPPEQSATPASIVSTTAFANTTRD